MCHAYVRLMVPKCFVSNYPINIPPSARRRPDARPDVGPLSADVGPTSGGRRVCPHVPRTSRAFADFRPTLARYCSPSSARHASRDDVGTMLSHCHPDVAPILRRRRADAIRRRRPNIGTIFSYLHCIAINSLGVQRTASAS